VVSEHSGRGVFDFSFAISLDLCSSCYIIDHLGFACCFSLDLISIIERIDRSDCFVPHIVRSKNFDRVLNKKPFHILVDYVIDLLDPKVSCDCVTRSVVKIIDQDLIISFHHPLNLIC